MVASGETVHDGAVGGGGDDAVAQSCGDLHVPMPCTMAPDDVSPYDRTSISRDWTRHISALYRKRMTAIALTGPK